MATRIKGICKGIKHISHLFAVKERDIEIGYPTDVKHVAHIGLDGAGGSAPSWMNDFKSGPDFSAASVGSMSLSREQTWSSQDFDQQSSIGRQPSSDIFHNFPPTNVPKIPKKQKRKKGKSSSSSSTSSPKKSSSSSKMSNSSSRSSRVSRKSDLNEENENTSKEGLFY